MATALTFEVGRRPGAARRQSWGRKPAAGMNHRQRDALAGLVHGPDGPGKASFESPPASKRDRRGTDYIWFAVLALAFLLGSRALFEGIRFVHTADALQIIRHAEPHVDVTVTRLPTTTDNRGLSKPGHSSDTLSRTM
ncbi:MAG: hypothetical protein E6H48_10020 [Betaproteobacteria bacterium]|nr:MAG: hypothetical protein E6H48_10020 [Betaproteobacteria bacterium]